MSTYDNYYDDDDIDLDNLLGQSPILDFSASRNIGAKSNGFYDYILIICQAQATK